MELITVSPPKQQEQPPSPPKKKKKKKKKKTVQRQALPTVVFPGVTRREFAGMKNKMDRVLEMVAAYPTPATDQEINSRLYSIVSNVVDKQLTAALSKQDQCLKAIEESTTKKIQNIDGLLMDVAKIHGFEIAERDRRIQDPEHLNLKLITAEPWSP